MFRTLKKDQKGTYRAACPSCQETTKVKDDSSLSVITSCRHFVRRWRVTKDRRVRAEFRDAEESLSATT